MIFPALLLALLLLTGCQGVVLPAAASPTPTILFAPTMAASPPPTPASASASAVPPASLAALPVAINGQDVRQTLREVGGGNYIHYFADVTTALDPISTLNLDTLHPQVVRVRIDLDEWEPKAGVTGAERFQLGPHVRSTFEFMKEMKSRSPDTLIIASIWKVPDWMVSNPGVEEGRSIPPERYPAVVDSIGNWLLRARDDYGVTVDDVSFNEANIGVTVSLAPAEQVALIRQGGPQLQKLGLKTHWLLGDTSDMESFPGYTPEIYAAEDIRPYLGPLSFHSWDAGSPDQTIQAIGKFADLNHLEVWCTESGWNAAAWKTPDEFTTWNYAMGLAAIDTRVLRDSRATTLLYWQMMGEDYNINDGSRPFPALVYLQELQSHFPAGAQIVGTLSDPNQTMIILSLAARTPGGGFSVELINQIQPERRVLLSGLPDGTYTLVRLLKTRGREDLAPVQVKEGRAEVSLPGMSIEFLKLEK